MRGSVLEQSGADAADAAPAQEPASRRASTLSAVALSVLLTAGLYGLQFLLNPRFFFIDDRVADTLPKLVDVGRSVRDGEWPWLTTDAVNSGAHAVEYLNGVFNPLLVGAGVVLAGMDDLALGAFLLVLVHVLLLAAAAAWLGRLLGLGTAWAVAFALSCSVQPYTLLWGAAAWIQAVSSFSWFVLAVAAAVALHLRRRHRYGWVLLVAVFGCCTSGWPLAVPVLAVVVLVLLAVRTLRGGDVRTTAWLAAWSAGGGLCSLVALYPLTRAFEFATRSSDVANEGNFNVVSLEGLLQFANPAYYGFLNSFGGYALQEIPHYYAAWFVLPVLVLWRAERLPPRASLLAVLSVVLLGLAALGGLGPEQLFSFRYPSRFLQYSSFFLLMTTAVLVAHGRFAASTARLKVLLGLLLLLAVLSLQADPAGGGRVWGTLAGVAALSAGLWWSVRRSHGRMDGTGGPGRSWSGVVAAAGTAALLVSTLLQHPDGRGIDYDFPRDVSALPALSEDDYTLFYGTYMPADLPDARGFHAEYHPSGTGLMVGDRQLNGYSPIGHSAFRRTFPMDDQGNFEPGDSGRFADVDPGTGLQALELLKVDQVIALRGPWTDDLRRDLGPEWDLERARRYTTVWTHAPYDLPGLVSYVSPGVRVGDEPSCEQRHLRECVPLRVAPSSDGRVVFARLWFPGYTAVLDGEPLPVERYADMLVSVVVPPGSTGELVLTYRSPHVRKLALLAGLTVVGLAVASLRYPLAPTGGSRRGRPRRSRH